MLGNEDEFQVGSNRDAKDGTRWLVSKRQTEESGLKIENQTVSLR